MSTSFILHASYIISINAGAIVSTVLNSGDVPFPLMVLFVYPLAFFIPDSKT